jgi:hypothetical protein
VRQSQPPNHVHTTAPGAEPLPTAIRFSLAAAAFGLIVAIAHALVIGGYRRFMLAYLVAFAFVLSLSLGGLFFVIVQHLTRAGWSVLVRRPAEAMAATSPLLLALFAPIALSVVLGHGEIYPWAQPLPQKHDTDHVAQATPKAPDAAHDQSHDTHAAAHPHHQLDELTFAKRAWLNPAFFLARCLIYLATWSLLGLFFWKHSTLQDATGDIAHTRRMETIAGPGALVLGITIMFASFDLLMSINPHWYSTIFGIYYFCGAAVGALAAATLLLLALQRAGLLSSRIGEAHYLDLGRLLFAFIFFWAYIAFCQYMLLWYANMPETTGWLRQRGATTIAADINGWTTILLVLLFGHFLIPFCGLMSRHVKRRRMLLAFWALWMLAMHYLDLLWLVMPEYAPHVTLGGTEIGLLLCLAGVYVAATLRILGRHNLIPQSDPRLHESIRFETVY